MNAPGAADLFQSLASEVRLDVYRRLVRRGTEGMVAGEIAAALGLPPNNVSFHLKTLTHAGLVTVEQEGRYQRYRANLPLMAKLVTYLTDECCGGHPERCLGSASAATAAAAGRRGASRRAGARSAGPTRVGTKPKG